MVRELSVSRPQEFQCWKATIIIMSDSFLACAQLQSLTYLRSGPRWGVNKWDTCRKV